MNYPTLRFATGGVSLRASSFGGKTAERKSNRNYQGEIFNIGSGKQYRIKEVVSIVEKLLGKKLNVSYGRIKSYYQEPKVLIADNSKVKAAFNWRINHDFKSGIAKTVDSFKKNKELYL